MSINKIRDNGLGIKQIELNKISEIHMSLQLPAAVHDRLVMLLVHIGQKIRLALTHFPSLSSSSASSQQTIAESGVPT
jgi:hypothetical protein